MMDLRKTIRNFNFNKFFRIPKIIVDSPETGSSFSDQKSKKKFNKNEECNTPFKIFDLETTTRRRSFKVILTSFYNQIEFLFRNSI